MIASYTTRRTVHEMPCRPRQDGFKFYSLLDTRSHGELTVVWMLAQHRSIAPLAGWKETFHSGAPFPVCILWLFPMLSSAGYLPLLLRDEELLANGRAHIHTCELGLDKSPESARFRSTFRFSACSEWNWCVCMWRRKGLPIILSCQYFWNTFFTISLFQLHILLLWWTRTVIS